MTDPNFKLDRPDLFLDRPALPRYDPLDPAQNMGRRLPTLPDSQTKQRYLSEKMMRGLMGGTDVAPHVPMLPGGLPAPEPPPEAWHERALPKARVGEGFDRGVLSPDVVVGLLNGGTAVPAYQEFSPGAIMENRLNRDNWWGNI